MQADSKGPTEETLKGLLGVMTSAVDPDFEGNAADIRKANTSICAVCGQIHMHRHDAACSGCKGLLDAGQTALVSTDLRFCFVEFPEDGENADLRGKIESIDDRVMDTFVAKAARDESAQNT